MNTQTAILLLTGLSLITSCDCGEYDHDDPKVEKQKAGDLSTLSDEKLIADLEGLKMVQSDVREDSDTPFAGSQAKLDKLLEDLLTVFPEDQYEITWIPSRQTDDEGVEGVIRAKAFPDHARNIDDYVRKYEKELERRRATLGEQDAAPDA